MIPTFQLGGLGRGGGLSLEERMRQLFAGGIPGVMFDWVKASNLYQDSARTTLVSANGDPIGSVTDLSGNGKHASQATSTSRAPWAGGYAANDGVDDGWQTPAIDFTGTDAVTLVAAIKKRSDAAAGIAIEFGTNFNTAGGFGLFVPAASSPTVAYNCTSGSGGRATAQTTGVTAPVKLVATGISKISTDKCILRINGVQVANSVADQGTGQYGNLVLNIGRRNNSSGPAAVDYYRLAIIGRELSASELTGIAEAWANQSVGTI